METKKHENFIDFVKSGGRLSYKQIKDLNSVYKDDYMKLMLNEGDNTNKYLEKVVLHGQEVTDEIGQV